MTTALTPTGTPCVVTHWTSSSASWMSSESRRAVCRPGMTSAPLPTTILNPSPAASPVGPEWAPQPEMISASFGSATLYINIVSAPCLAWIRRDHHGTRRLVLDDDRAPAGLDRLEAVCGVRVECLDAAADGKHHLAHCSGRDPPRDPPDLADQLVIGHGQDPSVSGRSGCRRPAGDFRTLSR